ncbi:hypothetical protein ADIARSV_0715 [Arcticibacter svalbardensis MN12-7]|uniref:Uncharacterized protein n=1 Tax=Arcticibacter svalbardensis MN12-7 TaxID=1150600 RepID=R9GWE4_9SPHI|nr:hypothetical protein ADIARSV_0715 [Arcticibacter svalbardensis MN12-7]
MHVYYVAYIKSAARNIRRENAAAIVRVKKNKVTYSNLACQIVNK